MRELRQPLDGDRHACSKPATLRIQNLGALLRCLDQSLDKSSVQEQQGQAGRYSVCRGHSLPGIHTQHTPSRLTSRAAFSRRPRASWPPAVPRTHDHPCATSGPDFILTRRHLGLACATLGSGARAVHTTGGLGGSPVPTPRSHQALRCQGPTHCIAGAVCSMGCSLLAIPFRFPDGLHDCGGNELSCRAALEPTLADVCSFEFHGRTRRATHSSYHVCTAEVPDIIPPTAARRQATLWRRSDTPLQR